MAGQIEKSIIIKLRESESTNIANGNFTTTLAKPITLEEGDQVRIHTAILDTSSQGLISVAGYDDDGDVAVGLDIEVDVLRWWRFSWQHRLGDQDPAGDPLSRATAIMSLEGVNREPTQGVLDAGGFYIPWSEIPTNKRYFAALRKPFGAEEQNIWKVNWFVVWPTKTGMTWCGGCVLDFSYIDPVTNQEARVAINVPQFRASKGTSNGYRVSIQRNVVGVEPYATSTDPSFPGVYPSNNSFICLTSAATLNSHNLKLEPESADSIIVWYQRFSPTVQTYLCTPFIRTLKVNIPNKRYTPGEICTLLNDKFSSLEANGPAGADPATLPPIAWNVNNAFLGTIKEMEYYVAQNHDGVELGFLPETSYDEFGDVIDVAQMLIFDTNALEEQWTPPGDGGIAGPQDIYIGAEQVDLAYDPILEKISFSSLHFPLYVGSTAPEMGTAQPGIEWSRAPPYGHQAGQMIPDYSGAAFTRLYPQEFWKDQLGFQSIVLTPTSCDKTFREDPGCPASNVYGPAVPARPPSGATISGFNIVPQVGLNITSAFMGLDVIVFKSDIFWMPQTPKSGLNWMPGDVGTVTSLTTPIFADREFGVAISDEGYFLVEVGFKFPQSLIGGTGDANVTNRTYNNIQAIVGKYFVSPNNFLQDQGSGSIQYQHMGKPQMISDLSVRILNPDGSVPPDTDLGNRNALFLEIIKAINVTPAPLPKNPIVPIRT